MIRKRGRLMHGLIVASSIFPALLEMVAALWRRNPAARVLIPLVTLLFLGGLLLILAASVEALAPFIYTIF
jgi:Family of unknown function (DUF5989)